MKATPLLCIILADEVACETVPHFCPSPHGDGEVTSPELRCFVRRDDERLVHLRPRVSGGFRSMQNGQRQRHAAGNEKVRFHGWRKELK
jgi:hypothetical protein